MDNNASPIMAIKVVLETVVTRHLEQSLPLCWLHSGLVLSLAHTTPTLHQHFHRTVVPLLIEHGRTDYVTCLLGVDACDRCACYGVPCTLVDAVRLFRVTGDPRVTISLWQRALLDDLVASSPDSGDAARYIFRVIVSLESSAVDQAMFSRSSSADGVSSGDDVMLRIYDLLRAARKSIGTLYEPVAQLLSRYANKGHDVFLCPKETITVMQQYHETVRGIVDTIGMALRRARFVHDDGVSTIVDQLFMASHCKEEDGYSDRIAAMLDEQLRGPVENGTRQRHRGQIDENVIICLAAECYSDARNKLFVYYSKRGRLDDFFAECLTRLDSTEKFCAQKEKPGKPKTRLQHLSTVMKSVETAREHVKQWSSDRLRPSQSLLADKDATLTGKKRKRETPIDSLSLEELCQEMNESGAALREADTAHVDTKLDVGDARQYNDAFNLQFLLQSTNCEQTVHNTLSNMTLLLKSYGQLYVATRPLPNVSQDMLDRYNEAMALFFADIVLSVDGIRSRCPCCGTAYSDCVQSLDGVQFLVPLSRENQASLQHLLALCRLPAVESELGMFADGEGPIIIDNDIVEDVELMDDGTELGFYDNDEEPIMGEI